MEQTKESFEKFLERCSEANKHGDRPPVEEVDCPNCPGQRATLHSISHEHWIIPYHWVGTHWYYECDVCKEAWTTGESDGVTLASLKLVE